MKTLFLSTSTNETDKYKEGLTSLQAGEVHTILYDTTISDTDLYRAAKELQPDLIVYIGSRWGKQPATATLAQLNSKVAPAVHLCSDAADQPWWDLLMEYHYQGSFAVQVAIDGNRKWPLADTQLTLLTPVLPSDFPDGNKAHADRAAACVYAGNTGGPGSQRRLILSDLLQFKLISLRVRSDLPFTYDSYCEYLSAARMSLNVSFSGTEMAKQVKGRVVESGLAGACLLELQGSPTAEWFQPGHDYLEYAQTSDVRNHVERMKQEPEMTQEIGFRLRKRVLEEHSPKQFWSTIFKRLGFTA